MKKFLFIALAFVALFSQTSVAAKKEKKEMTWEWDGTKSGNQVIDSYLVNIDTLYTKVQTYKKYVDDYEVVDDTMLINGKIYLLSHMQDKAGQLLSKGRINWQCVQVWTEGTNIVLDMTNASLASATAALELPNLGLKAIKFGKYIKGGPVIIDQGIKAIKAVRGQYISNSRKWKAMKDGAIKDASTIGYEHFTNEVVQKLNKCYYIKEMREDDPDYQEFVARFSAKSEEEISKENQAIAQNIANSILLPEDKTKELEELPEIPED